MKAVEVAPTPLHVVVLADYGGSYAGTFVSMVRAIVREARLRGFSVEVILSAVAFGRSWLSELDRDGVAYRFAPDLRAGSLRQWLADNVLIDSRTTVLHTHFTKFDVPAALASRGRANVRVFWHIHSPASQKLLFAIRNAIKYAFVGRLVRKIFCVAPNIARDVRQRGGSPKRVIFMPNAIETERFPRTTPADRLAARQRFGLPLEGNILLHFGWDWSRKGGDVFVRTVGIAALQGASVLGVTVGGGAVARAAVAGHKLDKWVRVLDPLDDVRSLYAAADLFVSPSLAEGMPFAMTEALCTGLAVVGSDIPGQAAIGRNIEACRLTPLDPVLLADAVRATLERSADTIVAEGDAARAEIVRSFDLVPWAKRMVDNYVETPGLHRS